MDSLHARQWWRQMLVAAMAVAALVLLARPLPGYSEPPDVPQFESARLIWDGIVVAAGSPAVQFAPISSSMSHPVVVAGAAEFAASDGESNYLYRVDDSAAITRVPMNVSIMGPTPAAAAGDALAIRTGATGQDISLIAQDGTATSVAMPPPQSTVGDPTNASISVIASDGISIFAVRNNEQAIYVFHTSPSLALAQRIPTPADLPPPTLVQPIGHGNLLAWSLEGSGLIDIATGEFSQRESGNLTPYAFGGARIVATAEGNPIQLAPGFEPGAMPPAAMPIAQAPDGATWDTTAVRGLLLWQKDSRPLQFTLPTFEIVPACPYVPSAPPSYCKPFIQALGIEDAAVLPSGALVFVATNGALGFIPAPSLPPLTRESVLPMVANDASS